MQHYLACDRVKIHGITVINRNNYNNDALDLDGCHNVTVSDMIADSDDDGITLKSTSPRLCEDITISNCVVSSHCNAIKLGTETNGGFRNIIVRGVVVKPSADQSSRYFGLPTGHSAISLEIVDGGTMSNVDIADITHHRHGIAHIHPSCRPSPPIRGECTDRQSGVNKRHTPS